MAGSEAKLAVRSRSEIVHACDNLMLFKIEELGEGGEIAAVEYQVSCRDSHERWIFDNQFEAAFCFYEAMKTTRGRIRA